jgi:hypothetical protein
MWSKILPRKKTSAPGLREEDGNRAKHSTIFLRSGVQQFWSS